MKDRLIYLIRKHLWLILLLIVAVGICTAVLLNRRSDFTGPAANRLTSLIAGRMEKLDGYMQEAAADDSKWPEFKDFPEDMVIYRYVNDSLNAWCNQFTLDNDDIGRRVYVQRFINLRFNIVSPLASADTVASYMNIGPKWYLVKALYGPRSTVVIGGLEIKNTMATGSYNGVNPKLKVSDRFSIYPISYTGGAPVYIDGRPLIKIIQENTGVAPLLPEPIYIWLALFVLVAAMLYYLYNHRTIRVMALAMTGISVLIFAIFWIGRSLHSVSDMFSPTVYAQGSFFYSLAVLIIVNLWIFLMVFCAYLSRASINKYMEADPKGIRTGLLSVFSVAVIIAIAIYIHLTLKGLIMNSNITLELYKVSGINRYTVYIYISYLSLMTAIALLLQMLRPVLKKNYGLRYSMFSRTFRVIFAILSAAYLLSMSSVLGFRKEKNRVDIWANRLAVDRNPGFELRLRRIEMAIAGDPVIPALIPLNKDYRVVLNRIRETYLNRMSQEYETTLYMMNDADPVTDAFKYFNERIRNGMAIADSSRFIYSKSTNGRACYTGLFTYYNTGIGVTRLFIGIDSKLDKEGTGYSAIIGEASAGSVVIPKRYSYAKYLADNMVSYRGEYPYPTIFSGRLKEISEASWSANASIDKFVHFVTRISDEEIIVISRPRVDFMRYMVAGFLIALLAFFCISLPTVHTNRQTVFERGYYKTRINTVLYFSLFATLISMAAISVLFIYRRNETNVMNLMTGKINTIQSLVESYSLYFKSYKDFDNTDFSGALENIGSYTKSDISLYSLDGKVVKSTSPEVFERMLLGSRVNEEAYRRIMHRNKRYFIHKEKFVGHAYYAMYAPVINSEGKKIAIICSPYTDSALDFKSEAVFHALFIITAFLILIVITRILSSKIIDKMFRPLVEMGVKMNTAITDGLEYIIYDREDEISSLVHSYNLMVHDLSESSKQLAEIERNKAWSEMARQVAHEIKNPLTPIKLQIQRIIRLREKNDPLWEEKFDSIVPIIMDSIDGLTDTANEFSTFAKLYSEPPVLINLDEVARKQVALFDEKDNCTIQYMGLQNAMVLGPKPQITRVFVNLLSNAVQAVENQQREDFENGLPPKRGLVYISVRNSMKDGFYDVVVEDNGPGVKDEDRQHLFTPNFTTKSSGTGLGLAISKNIIELCGGEIQYSRSFSLQGACFTFRIPKASDRATT